MANCLKNFMPDFFRNVKVTDKRYYANQYAPSYSYRRVLLC